MEIEKIRKGVYAELPKLLEVVKAGAIEKEMGVTNGWISNRLHRAQNGPYCVRKFRGDDADKLNRGLWALGEKLMRTNITWSADRKECVTSLKENLKTLFIKVLAERKLGISKPQLGIYMSVGGSVKHRAALSEEQIQQFVIGAREIGLRLISTELYIDEE